MDPVWSLLIVGTIFVFWVELPVQKRLPDFHEWCRVTRHPRIFSGLTGCQRTPGFGASQLGIRAKVNDYLGSLVGVELRYTNT